jgi:hypothetical protein
VRTGVSPGHSGASGAKGCVLTAPPGSAHGRDAVAAGEVCQQEVYGFLGTYKPGYSILPGFMTPVGSSARLIARITSVAWPISLSR